MTQRMTYWLLALVERLNRSKDRVLATKLYEMGLDYDPDPNFEAFYELTPSLRAQ